MNYLIVGLGNIGPQYALTRHNIGFMSLDWIARQEDLSFEMKRLAYHTEWKHRGRVIHLIKPTTYMNLSGKAVNYYMKQLNIPVERLLVITDDLALPYGKLRLKPKGSSGGHNGLKDIEANLGSVNYPRLKFGIGDNFSRGRQVDYVLNEFSEDEFALLPERLNKVKKMVIEFTTVGLERTMNLNNE